MEKLFNFLWNNAYLYRKHIDNADGRAYWQLTKKILAQYDDIVFPWKRNDDMYRYFLSFDGDDEPSHFLFQLGNIPQGDGNARKLIQIALNLGQHKQAANDRDALSDITIHTFVSDDILSLLDGVVKESDIRQIIDSLKMLHENSGIVYYEY